MTHLPHLRIDGFVIVMGMFDEIEPTPWSVDLIKTLPEDKGLTVLSLLRFRRDLADGRSDRAWQQWQDGIVPVLKEYGCERRIDGDIAFPLIGVNGGWDVVGAFWYPGPRVLWRFMRDARTIDLVKIRRQAAEDVIMLVIPDRD
jgi:hypothetical protein